MPHNPCAFRYRLDFGVVFHSSCRSQKIGSVDDLTYSDLFFEEFIIAHRKEAVIQTYGFSFQLFAQLADEVLAGRGLYYLHSGRLLDHGSVVFQRGGVKRNAGFLYHEEAALKQPARETCKVDEVWVGP